MPQGRIRAFTASPSRAGHAEQFCPYAACAGTPTYVGGCLDFHISHLLSGQPLTIKTWPPFHEIQGKVIYYPILFPPERLSSKLRNIFQTSYFDLAWFWARLCSCCCRYTVAGHGVMDLCCLWWCFNSCSCKLWPASSVLGHKCERGTLSCSRTHCPFCLLALPTAHIQNIEIIFQSVSLPVYQEILKQYIMASDHLELIDFNSLEAIRTVSF